MKALTVQQPWAWAIVHGGKDVENRTQAWSYRGPLAIHAGQAYARHIAPPDLLLLQEALRAAHQRLNLPELRPLPGSDPGCIIGVVDLVDAHNGVPGCCASVWGRRGIVNTGRRFAVPTHLVLEHPRPLRKSIPAGGRLGLWDLDGEQLAALIGEGVLSGMECA